MVPLLPQGKSSAESSETSCIEAFLYVGDIVNYCPIYLHKDWYIITAANSNQEIFLIEATLIKAKFLLIMEQSRKFPTIVFMRLAGIIEKKINRNWSFGIDSIRYSH